jgi:hypothetical protein
MKKLFWRILIGFGLVFWGLKAANWSAKHGHTLPPPPHPNGYEEILSAAEWLKPLPKDLIELSADEVQQLAEQNRPAVELAKKALRLDSAVPLEPTKIWNEKHLDDLTRLKQLTVAIGMESRTQMLAGNTNESARCDLDLIRLAQTTRRGGLMIDGITSLGIETIGAASLHGKISRLDAAGCRELAAALETICVQREKPEVIIATEKAWSAQRFGLVHWIGGIVARTANHKNDQRLVTRSHAAGNQLQRLLLRLAARAYALENQHPPTLISELVPTYLKSVPRDFETGKEFQEIPKLAE